MRSKKLTRQLKKSLDREEIESELPKIQEWLTAQGAPAAAGASVEVDSLRALVENFPAFLEAVDSAYQQYETNLEHAQRSLELSSQEVEERNKLLRVENKKVSDLLNNMRQAVFSVEKSGTVVAPVSIFAEQVFGRSIVGANFLEIVYAGLDPRGEEHANLRSAFAGVFGEGILQWDLMEGYFPRRAILGHEAGQAFEKILRVSVSPIWDEQENLERLMVIVDDVTEVEKLERRMLEEREKSNRSLQIIQELVGVPRPALADFLSAAAKSVAEVRTLLESNGAKADFNLIFRLLHTVKGNARGYKLNVISGSAHRVESLVVTCRDLKGSSRWDSGKTEVFAEVLALQDHLARYTDLAQKVLGIDFRRAGALAAGDTTAQRYDSTVISTLIQRMRATTQKLKQQSPNALVADLEDLLERASDVPLLPGFLQLKAMAGDLALDLGKTVDFEILDVQAVALESKLASAVQDALVHIVRNALDHGLESRAERVSQGKPEIGKLLITSAETNGWVRIEVADDGRGVNLSAIARKAVELGVMTEGELAQKPAGEILKLVFEPRLTTKTEVTDVSGRGAGLDAARMQIRAFGGDIEVSTKEGSGTVFRILLQTRAAKFQHAS